jgi:uncharacterized protein (AIM24 family)
MEKYGLMESTVKIMLLGHGTFIQEAEESGMDPEVAAEAIYTKSIRNGDTYSVNPR